MMRNIKGTRKIYFFLKRNFTPALFNCINIVKHGTEYKQRS